MSLFNKIIIERHVTIFPQEDETRISVFRRTLDNQTTQENLLLKGESPSLAQAIPQPCQSVNILLPVPCYVKAIRLPVAVKKQVADVLRNQVDTLFFNNQEVLWGFRVQKEDEHHIHLLVYYTFTQAFQRALALVPDIQPTAVFCLPSITAPLPGEVPETGVAALLHLGNDREVSCCIVRDKDIVMFFTFSLPEADEAMIRRHMAGLPGNMAQYAIQRLLFHPSVPEETQDALTSLFAGSLAKGADIRSLGAGHSEYYPLERLNHLVAHRAALFNFNVFWDKPRRRIARMRSTLTLAGIALILLLALLLSGPLANLLMDRHLDAYLAELRPQQQLLRKKYATLKQTVQLLADIRAKTSQAPDMLRLLAELSNRLPQGSYINRLEISGRTVTFSGLSDNAGALLGVLEQSRMFLNPQFIGNLRSNPDGQAFTVKMELQP